MGAQRWRASQQRTGARTTEHSKLYATCGVNAAAKTAIPGIVTAAANAACVAYAADERARAALPTMNVSRGDVDVLFAPEEEAWD